MSHAAKTAAGAVGALAVAGLVLGCSSNSSTSSGTGAYTGATGSGSAVIKQAFSLPKLKTGACNLAGSAVPAAGSVTFTAAGPVTLK